MLTFAALDPDTIPAALVSRARALLPGARMPATAVHNAVILEYIARMATHTLALNPDAAPLPRALHDKHFLRKHGAKAYYGQVPRS